MFSGLVHRYNADHWIMPRWHCVAAQIGWIPDPGDEATRHNQRLSRKVSKGSEGQ